MAELAPLATLQELIDYAQDDVNPTTGTLLLALASQVVRTETQQMITAVTDDTVRLEGGRELLFLPERPIKSVSAVSGLYYATTADPFYYDIPDAAALFGPLPPGIWVLDAQSHLRLPVGSLWPPVVEVTYSHGYDAVPADLKAVCLESAKRQWINPGGYEQFTTGGIRAQFPGVRSGPTAGTVGGLMLTVNELRICRRYRLGTR